MTGSEVAVHNGGPHGDNLPVAQVRSDPTSELIAWGRAAEAALELARPLSQTSFVPKDYQGEVGNCTAAILYGAEVGLSPMQSLQGIYVISGKPALYARTLLAVVLAAGHEVWTEKSGPDRVVVKGRRRGSDRIETADWPLSRAASYARTNKRYDLEPESMLLARAQSEVCRKIAPDAILGMAYSVEELQDDAAEAKPTSKRTVQRKPQPEPEAPELPAPPPRDRPQEPDRRGHLRSVDDVGLPPLPDEPPAEQAPEPETAPAPPPTVPGPKAKTEDRPGFATAASLRMLHALEGAAGLTDRDARLALYSRVAGRKVESSSDLTRIECSRLLDHLKAQTEPAPEPEDGWPPDPEDGLFPDGGSR